MAWIELHDTLPDHDKVLDVAEALKMDKDLVVGKLVRLWTWALNNREEGAFKARDIQTIAEVMRYKGKPQRLVDALAAARLLDLEDDTYSIHDWDERVGMLLAKREKTRSQARDRKRKQREKERDENDGHENVTRDKCDSHAVTVPKPYLNQDIPPYNPPTGETPAPPKPDKKPTLSREQEARFQQFYTAYPRHIAVEAARKAWAKIKPDDALTEQIVAGVKRSIAKDKRFCDGYVPHPATWLNAREWENEYTGQPPRKGNARNYSQRKYTPEELSRIGVDLLKDV